MANFYDSRTVYSGALPGGGATLTTDPIAINGYSEFTPLLTYARGAAGGAVNVRVQISLDNSPGSFFTIGESQSAAIVPGTSVLISSQQSSITYTSTGAGTEKVTLPTYTCVGSYVRFLLAETGAVGTPGNVQVEVFLRGNQ